MSVLPSEPTSARRLLLVAYAFPPVGGAGVQRPVKWVKYLHRQGWQVTVLTPANPSVPVLDRSLLDDVPAGTTILRARTWEPGYQVKQQLGSAHHNRTLTRSVRGLAKAVAARVLQPDPQILWYRNAMRCAADHLRHTPHDAILVTAPPFSSFLVGTAVKRRFGLPLVLDYRDEWDLSSRYLEHAQRDRFSRIVQERMQRRVLSQADAVVASTQASLRHLEQRLHAIGHPARTACIYNGFDADDFHTPTSHIPAADPHTLRLVYTGTLWNLTDIEPLVTALECLHAAHPDVASHIELVCVGRKTPEQAAVLQRLHATGCRLVNLDYCDHAAALGWLHSADALCLLLSAVSGAERVVPAKLFEYLASRKDVLAVLPAGEAADLIRPFHPRSTFAPQETARMVAWLRDAVDRKQAVGTTPTGIPADISEYSRERQTGRLIELLDSLTRPAGATRTATEVLA